MQLRERSRLLSVDSFVSNREQVRFELIAAPWMTLDSVRDRHRHLVDHDWKSAAAEHFSGNHKDEDVSRRSNSRQISILIPVAILVVDEHNRGGSRGWSYTVWRLGWLTSEQDQARIPVAVCHLRLKGRCRAHVRTEAAGQGVKFL